MLLDLESLLAGLGVEPVGLEATSRDEFDALLDNVLSSTAGGDVDLDLDLELGVLEMNVEDGFDLDMDDLLDFGDVGEEEEIVIQQAVRKCAVCQHGISGKTCAVPPQYFHTQCFRCMWCSCPLESGSFVRVEDQLVCATCIRAQKAKESNRCFRCSEVLMENHFITVRGRKCCDHHFQCSECGCSFVGQTVYERARKFYCEADYIKLQASKCYVCDMQILGKVVNVLGRHYHPEHFTCKECDCVLSVNKYFVADGEPVCEADYAEQFAESCAKCGLPIVGQKTDIKGKFYHPKCMVCTKCRKPFRKGQVFEHENAQLCSLCYAKLPLSERRKIDKKKREEEAIAKYYKIKEEQERLKQEKLASKKSKKSSTSRLKLSSSLSFVKS